MEEKPRVPVEVGDILADKYRVERVLGMGGMGVVLAATHLELGELRAVKMMLPSAERNDEAVERFLREARAAVRLKSKHVVKIHDVGRLPGGAPYFVMEHLEGRDLREHVRARGALPVPEAVDLVMQALEALAEAHGAGIVHRDLKPANLFIVADEDGLSSVKVLDFGISKITAASMPGALDMTRTHSLMGSPFYMSPEQMKSTRDVDVRTDIWSMGIILYELLAGEVPFRGETITAQCALVLQETPAAPSKRARASLPPGIDAVVLRCLEKSPAMRYANVLALGEALCPFGSDRAHRSLARIRRLDESAADISYATTEPRPSPLADLATTRRAPPKPGLGDIPTIDAELEATGACDGQGATVVRPSKPGTDLSQSTRSSWGTSAATTTGRSRATVVAALAVGLALFVVAGGWLALWVGSDKTNAMAPPAPAPSSPIPPAPAASVATSPPIAPATPTPSAPAPSIAPVTSSPIPPAIPPPRATGATPVAPVSPPPTATAPPKVAATASAPAKGPTAPKPPGADPFGGGRF